ncbi:MAG: SDR family NAD(P)-dependent oxidoreductase [Myxococcota bacterium]
MKPVCPIIGAGAGFGGHVGKRFAREGDHAVLCRRSDEAGLRERVKRVGEAGESALGFLLDALGADGIEECVAALESETGPIEVAGLDLGAQIGSRPLRDTSDKAVEMGWRLATFAIFRTASAVCPDMETRGTGTLLVTPATAALRGNADPHSHAAAMGGRRLRLPAKIADTYLHLARQHRSAWTHEIDLCSVSDRPWWDH